MRDHDNSMNGPLALRIVKLRRTLAAAQRRYARRHNRSNTIWHRFRDYYGKNPRLSSRMTIYDPWGGCKRQWSYESAYYLELEAAHLMNTITGLLDGASKERYPLPRHDALLRVG
jgi:hypothetical protein